MGENLPWRIFFRNRGERTNLILLLFLFLFLRLNLSLTNIIHRTSLLLYDLPILLQSSNNEPPRGMAEHLLIIEPSRSVHTYFMNITRNQPGFIHHIKLSRQLLLIGSRMYLTVDIFPSQLGELHQEISVIAH